MHLVYVYYMLGIALGAEHVLENKIQTPPPPTHTQVGLFVVYILGKL